MNNKSKELLKSIFLLIGISVGGVVLSQLGIKFLTPYTQEQTAEGNLTFLYIVMLIFLGWFTYSIFAIGLSKLNKFSYVRYIYADNLLPIWTTYKFIAFYLDFAGGITEDEDTPSIVSIYVSKILPILAMINSILFWVVTVGGYIYLSFVVGMFNFTDRHTLYVLISIGLFLNGITIRSLQMTVILISMSGALRVFNVKLAVITNLLLPVVCFINIVLILLGVIGIIPSISIPILNMGFILLPSVQPLLHMFQFIISSKEAELNLIEED